MGFLLSYTLKAYTDSPDKLIHKVTPFRSINYEYLGLNAFRLLIPRRTIWCFVESSSTTCLYVLSQTLPVYITFTINIPESNAHCQDEEQKKMPTTVYYEANPSLIFYR